MPTEQIALPLSPTTWTFVFKGNPIAAKTALDADKSIPYFVRLAIDVLLGYVILVKAQTVDITASGTVASNGQTYNLVYDWYLTGTGSEAR